MRARTFIPALAPTIAIALALLLGSPAPAPAYSVLAHESAIDAAWEAELRPLLLQRFPRSTPAELERARTRALGDDTYSLVSATPFAPATRRGHKVAAKGLVYRQPGDYRLNVTALETLADTCG